MLPKKRAISPIQPVPLPRGSPAQLTHFISLKNQVNTLHILGEICQEFIEMDYKPRSLQKCHPAQHLPAHQGTSCDTRFGVALLGPQGLVAFLKSPNHGWGLGAAPGIYSCPE